RAAHHETIGLAVPDDAIGAFPTVAGAGFARVLRVEVVAVDDDIVPEGGRGPAMMWAGFRMGIVAETVHEYIRAGSKGLGDVLVPVLARVTISHQAHRVVVHHKCVTAAAGDDRNRVQA